MPISLKQSLARAGTDAAPALPDSWPDWIRDWLEVWLPVIGSLGPLFILVSASVALFGIWMASQTARKRATFDMLEKSESTEHYRTSGSTFNDHFEKPMSEAEIDNFISSDQPAGKVLRRSIIDYLNHYEFMSLGVRQRAFHEKTYRKWMRSAVVRDWNRAAPLIQQLRWQWDESTEKWIYQERQFEHLERLARRFSRRHPWLVFWPTYSVERISKKSSGPPDNPRGTADEAIPREDDDEVDESRYGGFFSSLWPR